ncbi:TolC family protein [Pontibacter akesuensis]|uniref:Outer membrane protein TolC n=1 Tax=Pontibacter akesuensis TaxID=388950 RepID=A0A1I7KW74_9BACT|nr:TolC family protein [Pontibacter akesuensis]GHA80525.1 transporter [Pontibacter akesuensis]SFV01742.1 Outer membrane protein TolC [Pontibacter akesuensis]
MIKKFFIVGALSLFLHPAFAQGPVQSSRGQELTLQESIKYALEHNEDIQKASYDELGAKYQINEARSAGLPQVDIKGTAVRTLEKTMIALPADFNPEGTGPLIKPMGTDNTVQGGISVSQLLFSKSYFVGLKAAKSAGDLYRIRKEMATEDVIYNVGSAFYQVLQTEEQFNSINANLDKLNQLEKILTLQYKNDLVKKVDVNRIKVNKINLENQKANLEAAYVQQLNVLKFFMGMPLDEQIALQGTAEEVLLEQLPTLGTAGEAATARTELRVLNKQKELKAYEIENIRAGYYPSLSAFGNYNYQSQYDGQMIGNSDAMWSPNSQVGLQLNIPVFDGLRKKAQVQQRQVELKKMDLDIQQYNKNTQVELSNALSQLSTSQNNINAQEENVQLAQEVYDMTNQLYKEALAPLSDLLDAEVSLRVAKTNLNNERLKYKIAQLDYLQAAGELEILVK